MLKNKFAILILSSSTLLSCTSSKPRPLDNAPRNSYGFNGNGKVTVVGADGQRLKDIRKMPEYNRRTIESMKASAAPVRAQLPSYGLSGNNPPPLSSRPPDSNVKADSMGDKYYSTGKLEKNSVPSDFSNIKNLIPAQRYETDNPMPPDRDSIQRNQRPSFVELETNSPSTPKSLIIDEGSSSYKGGEAKHNATIAEGYFEQSVRVNPVPQPTKKPFSANNSLAQAGGQYIEINSLAHNDISDASKALGLSSDRFRYESYSFQDETQYKMIIGPFKDKAELNALLSKAVTAGYYDLKIIQK